MSGVVQAQQPGSGAAAEKTVLRGTVINSVTHQPIGRALVKSTDGRFATMTNERGQFEMRFKVRKVDIYTGAVLGDGGAGPTAFSDGAGGITGAPGVVGGLVPQGQQGQVQQVHQQGQEQQSWVQDRVDRPDFLTAVRVGYLAPQTSWGNGVQVARDQEEVTIALTPEAKVIGHVTLADGEGAAGIPLELYRRVVENGRARWNNVGSAQARSDGEFRFADLEAGTYKLYSAELPDNDPVSSNPRGQGYGYPPDYFPGTSDFAGGAVIHLAAGETFQATLTPEKRRYYPVHIGVNNGGQGRQFDIQVERDGHPGPGFTLGNDFRDGSIGGMLPDGNYLVRVSTQENVGLTGLVNLSVHGGPAAAMVTLLPGIELEVRVSKELQESGPQLSETTVGGFGRARRTATIPLVLQLMPVEEFGSGRAHMAGPPAGASRRTDW